VRENYHRSGRVRTAGSSGTIAISELGVRDQLSWTIFNLSCIKSPVIGVSHSIWRGSYVKSNIPSSLMADP
jgi:hypothetical protein